MTKRFTAFLISAVMLLSCSGRNSVKVELQSQYYDFTEGTLQSELALPSDIKKGFTVCMDVDFSAPAGILLEAPGIICIEKTAEAVEVRLSLQQYYDPADFKVQRVAVPFKFVPALDGVHNLTVNFTGPMLEVYLDGRLIDNDASLGYPVGNAEWAVSDAVKSVKLYAPALKAVRAANKEDNSTKYSANHIQYWTPDFYNGWVGDVVSCYHQGRYHVFYLFDRRHHSGKFGQGGHWFEHLSTTDFKTWTEHETVLPISDQWITFGTGTAFTWHDSLLLTYGYHTYRFHPFDKTTYMVAWNNTNEKGISESFQFADYPELFPEGASYAISPDGVQPFEASTTIFHYSENPSAFPNPDGDGLKMYANCGAKGTWVAEDIEGPWTCTDADFPPGGDCTFPFVKGDWEYIIGGFRGMWYRSRIDGGPFKDMIPEALDLYNGQNVPTITNLPDGRSVIAGWTNNEGWGGNLTIYEIVQHADGTLGTRWMDEITPVAGKVLASAKGDASFSIDPSSDCLISFEADPSEAVSVRFTCADRPGEVVEWFLEPDKNKASYVCYNVSNPRPYAPLIAEDGHPEFLKDYAVKVNVSNGGLSVRMMLHNEAKMSGTLIDTEINRDRTMLDYYSGFKFDSVAVSGVRNVKIQSVK